MYIIMLGAPGAGKGTQADILCDEMSLPHIASGNLLREEVEKKTELGLLAKSYMDRGELGPEELVTKMILQRIERPDCASGCVFDGFPRTLSQAKTLDKGLGDKGKHIDNAVYINVSQKELLKRLIGRWLCRKCQTPYHQVTAPPRIAGKCDKCGGELYQRDDDKEETIKERLKVFFALTVPIIDYYRKQNKLVEVNGNQGIPEVARELKTALRGKAK